MGADKPETGDLDQIAPKQSLQALRGFLLMMDYIPVRLQLFPLRIYSYNSFFRFYLKNPRLRFAF